MSDLSLRVAAGDEDCRAIVGLLLEMFAEVGRASLDFRKGTWEVDRIVREDAAWLVELDGKIIASAGIVAYQPWYSAETALTEAWFYVRPEHRKTGRAFRLLFAELKALCASTGMAALITYFNPGRPARAGNPTSIGEKFFVDKSGDATPAGEVVILSSGAS